MGVVLDIEKKYSIKYSIKYSLKSSKIYVLVNKQIKKDQSNVHEIKVLQKHELFFYSQSVSVTVFSENLSIL